MFEETSNPYYTRFPSFTFVLIVHITRKSEMNVVMLPRGHPVAQRVGLQSTFPITGKPLWMAVTGLGTAGTQEHVCKPTPIFEPASLTWEQLPCLALNTKDQLIKPSRVLTNVCEDFPAIF